MWLEYNLHYKPELKTKSLSFFIERNDEIIAIVPLFLEKNFYNEFSMAGGPIPFPAFKNNLHKKDKNKIVKFVFKKIDELAKKYNIARTKIRFSPLSPSSLKNEFPLFNVLMEYGYIDCSLNTQIINLKNENLWKDISRGNKNKINKGKKLLEFESFEKDNISEEIYKKYTKLHEKAAGRITRPLITFKMWHDWIKKGNGILGAVKIEDEYIGFSYNITYKNGVYYGSGANDPDHWNIPISNFLHWEMLLLLKEKEYDFYEMGIQEFDNLLYDIPTKKEKNISMFKRSFGGETYPQYMGEKYYSKELFLKTHQKRIKDYAEHIEI